MCNPAAADILNTDAPAYLVKAWQEAEGIRAFITDLEKRATASQGEIQPNSELAELIGWARGRANDIDPIKF